MPSRVTLGEINLKRLSAAGMRRLKDIPIAASWKFGKEAQENRQKIFPLEGAYKGERCVLMANGPSLAKMDFEKIKDEYSFGLNRIYLLFDKLPFEPDFYVCVNELVLEQFAAEISQLGMMKFINWNRHQYFDSKDEKLAFVKLGMRLGDQFGVSLQKPVSSGGTVTFVALQTAYYLGFKEVIIIGMDHNFVDKGTPNKTVERTASQDENHFHPDYFPKGSKWQLPDLRRSEVAYALAREAYEKDGRRIIDATEGGKCQVFEKAAFSAVFGG
jgi:6-hydroxymethylpterin diphosphokinase MptE-like